MREMRFTKAHDLGQLLDELEAAVPVLRSVTVGGERQAVMTLSSEGDKIVLLAPDETSQAEVAAVIAAHVPRAREAAPDLRALALSCRSSIQAATTLPQLKAALAADLFPLLRAIARGNRGDIN